MQKEHNYCLLRISRKQKIKGPNVFFKSCSDMLADNNWVVVVVLHSGESIIQISPLESVEIVLSCDSSV